MIDQVTMLLKFCTVVLFAFLASSNQVFAQEDCVAQSVTNLALGVSHFLTWKINPNETCKITQFLVYIYQRGKPIEYSFQTEETYHNVSFLRVCEPWIFMVIPISEHTRGHEHRLFASIPLPPGADLSIGSFDVSRNGPTGDLHLSWKLANTKYGSCSLRYRLTIEEETDPDIHDIYMGEESINLHFLSPCTLYQFGVRAINIAIPTVEGPERRLLARIPPAPQRPPHIDSIEHFPSGFNIVFSVQQLHRNRCPLLQLVIYGGRNFNHTITLDSNKRDPIKVPFLALIPNSMYYVRATVLNSAGWSQPNVVAVQTLEEGPRKDKADLSP